MRDDAPTTTVVTVDYPPSVGGKQRLLSDVYGGMENTKVIHPWRFPKKLFIYGFPLVAVYVALHTLWNRTDVLVAGQILPGGIIARIAGNLTGTPYLVYAHDTIDTTGERSRGGIISKLHRASCDGAEQFIAVSAYTKTLLVDLGVEREKITVIHPPVNTRMFSPADYDVEPHDVYVATVSRLTDRKNVSDVITVLERIQEEVDLDISYTVAGDGPKREMLERQAEEADLDVRILGYVRDSRLRNLYRSSDVFVLKSDLIEEKHKSEGFGIVYAEASASGIPVVGSDHSGIKDAIRDGITGYRADDDEELYRVLKQLIVDEDLRSEIGESGREFAERELAVDVIREETRTVLTRVAGGQFDFDVEQNREEDAGCIA